jgi:hypothetical protein
VLTKQLEIMVAELKLPGDVADRSQLRGLRDSDITHHAFHTFHAVRGANYTAPSFRDNLLRTHCVEAYETTRRKTSYRTQQRNRTGWKIPGPSEPQNILENKKMNRTELLETAASAIAGITTGCAFVLLYVLLATPVAETVQKFVA